VKLLVVKEGYDIDELFSLIEVEKIILRVEFNNCSHGYLRWEK